MAILNWRDHPRMRFVDFPPPFLTKGSVYIASDKGDTAWISDGTAYLQLYPTATSAQDLGVMTWALKPDPTSVTVGTRFTASDLNWTDWQSNGTSWVPVNGLACVFNWAAPSVMHASGSLALVSGVPGFFMPADLLTTLGLWLNVYATFHRETAATADQTGEVRIGVASGARQYGIKQFTTAGANTSYKIAEKRLINTGRTTFDQASDITGLVTGEENYDTINLSLISNQTIRLYSKGVASDGSDTLYFDGFRIEVAA